MTENTDEKEKCPICKKGEEECECEEMDAQDLVEHVDDKVDALISLLVKKGVITEEEYEKEFDELFEDDDEEKKEHPGDPIAN